MGPAAGSGRPPAVTTLKSGSTKQGHHARCVAEGCRLGWLSDDGSCCQMFRTAPGVSSGCVDSAKSQAMGKLRRSGKWHLVLTWHTVLSKTRRGSLPSANTTLSLPTCIGYAKAGFSNPVVSNFLAQQALHGFWLVFGIFQWPSQISRSVLQKWKEGHVRVTPRFGQGMQQMDSVWLSCFGANAVHARVAASRLSEGESG